MGPQTQTYLDLALLGKNAWWRYALGALIIAGSWLGLGFIPFLLLRGAGVSDPRLDFVAVNLSIFAMFGGLAVAVKLLHGRSLMSLITPRARIDWRRIGRGAAVWFMIAVLLSAMEFLLFRDRFYLSFNAAQFVPFLVLVLLFTPLQAATEELVFRGYTMQGLARLTRSPVAIAIVSSLMFTAPHLLNPEVKQHGVFLMGANYFAIGMLLATMTLRDGRLELAIGMHAVNNVFLGLVANYEESVLVTESIFTARELDPVYSLVSLAAGAVVFHAWVFGNRAAAGTGVSPAGEALDQHDLR